MRLVATAWSPTPEGLRDVVARAEARLAEHDRGRENAHASRPSHLIEARFDLLSRPATRDDVAAIAGAARGRLIATCRPGGTGSPRATSERMALLDAAIAAGAAGSDREHEPSAPRTMRRTRAGEIAILSWHGPRHSPLPPDRAQSVAAEMAACRPDIVKLAAPVECAGDALRLALVPRQALPLDVGWAPVALGHAGTWLRLLARRRLAGGGEELAALAYVAAGEPLPGDPTGQPRLDDALEAYAVTTVGDETRVLAVVGWPLTSTWSPLLHSALWRRSGAGAVLVALPVRDLDEARRLFDVLGIVGAAVTMPHKPAAAALAARVSPTVRESGVANTLRLAQQGAWEAESLDGAAAVGAIESAVSVRGARVAVLGAGGAARAAVVALRQAGARVVVLARRRDAARTVAQPLGAEWGRLDELEGLGADVVVNATPVGSAPAVDEMPVPAAALRCRAVLDIVTTPHDTALLRAARHRGCVAIDGLAMLARQAAAQQAWWSPVIDGAGPPHATPPAGEVERLLRDLACRRGD